MKLLKTSDELISYMKIKGIKFDIAKEEDAKVFVKKVVDYIIEAC